MDTSRHVIVTPLNEKNYATWKIQMKMNLIKEDLFCIVDGTEPPPATTADENVRKKFAVRRSKALAIIVLAIEPKQLYLLGDPTDPVEVWRKLQDIFQKKSWSNKLRLKKKLYNMKLEDGGDLQSHLKNFMEIYDELAVIGDPIAEEDRVINLLASLPDSFSTLVTALEATEKVPSWESVTERLIHEDSKTRPSEPTNSLSQTKCLATGNHRPIGKRVIKCFECNKVGHVRKNCYIYLKKNKSKVNTVVYDSDNNSDRPSPTGNTEITLAVQACVSRVNYQSWIVDSGATQHMTNDKQWFTTSVELNSPRNVEVGDGRTVKATAIGNISLQLCLPDGSTKYCNLKNVLFVPNLAHNLLSVSQTSKVGNVVQFEDSTCRIFKDNQLVAVADKIGKLYILHCVHDSVANCSELAENTDEKLWHRRFCHLGINNVRKLVKDDLVKGINCKVTKNDFFCVSCCDGKNHKLPFKETNKKQLEPFDLIHSDLCGGIDPMSLGGGSYFVTFTDDATRYCWVYILKKKCDVFSTFTDWKALVENQYGRNIKVFRTDNGGEYTSNEFETYLKKEGIVHQKTIPKTPEQNGVAERLNRTLVESVRSMLSDSGLPKTFWAEAVNTAAYVRNRSPTVALNNMTPYEALNGHKPNVKHFKIFGCKCYAHVPKDERSKLDSKSKHCIFVGYGSVTKGYRVYDLNGKKVFHCKDVIFHESQVLSPDCDNSKETNGEFSKKIIEVPRSDNDSDVSNDSDLNNDELQDENTDECSVRRSNRLRQAPDRLGEWVYLCDDNFYEPTTVKEALNGPDAHKWKKAMEAEFESINDNKVWSLVELPGDRKPITTKWVFKKKLGPDGSVSTFKARLVAQGFSQKLGIDYEETFSPVVRFESVRTVLALAAQNNLEVHQMDVKSAFLNGELNENLYVTQPEGFAISGKENLVCKLHKALYGLKQLPKCWNNQLDQYLKELNSKQSNSDSCIYTYEHNNKLTVIAVYVDDIIIAGHSAQYINKIKSELSSRYKMKDLGKMSYFLGVNVVQDADRIFINQSSYAQSLLKKFGFDNSKPVSTPADIGNVLEKATDQCELFDVDNYQSAVGSLLYLCTKTRPDITFAVCNVSKFCSRPTTKHWSAVKRIFRYLKGTYNFGIVYDKTNVNECIGFSDADWAGDKTDRKSMSGYCFKIGSGLVSWRSNKQSCIALSTAEAEYVALSAAAQ